MSDFARSMLEKYGWKEGKGLGKEESGISKPIKVKGNFNAYGLGHDVGQEFTNQWWDHLYNRTAGNVTVDTSEDGSVKFTRTADLQISKKVIPYASAETSQYSRFVKAGALTDTQEDEVEKGEAVSYNEVFKISGGRTAHKGARHGLTMAAKLARVEKQERELLDKWKNSKSMQMKDDLPDRSVDVDKNVESFKKKRKNSVNSSVNSDFQNACSEHLSKKHKKKNKIKLNNETEDVLNSAKNLHGDSVLPELVDDEFPHKKRKHKKKMIMEDENENVNSNEKQLEDLDSTDVFMKKKHKKKPTKPNHFEKENTKTEINVIENEVVKEKKRKKSKKESYNTTENVISGDNQSLEEFKESHDLIPEVQTSLFLKKKKKKLKNSKVDCDS